MADRDPGDFDKIADMLHDIIHDPVFTGDYPPDRTSIFNLSFKIVDVFRFAVSGRIPRHNPDNPEKNENNS